MASLDSCAASEATYSVQLSKKSNSNDELSLIFEKKFHYKKPAQDTENAVWKLPATKELFQEYYQLETLQPLKRHLNDVKSKLNDFPIEEWSVHTRKKDPAGEIPWRLKNDTKAEFVTVAWCKFFECLHKYPLVKGPQLNTLHLCEAPGAFITALNHFLYSSYDAAQVRWNWLASSMNPYYEGNPLSKMIIDDRFMLYTLDHWLFHEDFTGNIIDCGNIEQMQQQCAERLTDGVQLITADGSLDCIEVPDCQEEYVATLQFAEFVAALSILSDGGAFVVKMFTCYEASTVCKMFLLNCVFEEVHVFKPATSKRGNSEVYVVCLGYRKETKYLQETLAIMKSKLAEGAAEILPLFARAYLPTDFLLQHEICARLFMNFQISAIESNIYTFQLETRHNTRQAHQMRTQICNEFYKRYNVQTIPQELTVFYKRQDKIQIGFKHTVYKGSYTERKMLQHTTVEEQIFMLHSNLNELEKFLCGRYGILYSSERTAHSTSTELKVYKGMPVKTLYSSLFAAVHVLMLHSKFQHIFNIDPFWHNTPKCTLNQTSDIKFVLTKDFATDQQLFFVSILNALIEQKPLELVFNNFPFLTHYAVSILHYLIVHTQSALSICTEPNFTISLHTTADCWNNESVLSSLIQLRDLLQNDVRVMCILNIASLHRNELFKALAEYNNLLILNNFKLMLNN